MCPFYACSCKYLLESSTTDCHIKFFSKHSVESTERSKVLTFKPSQRFSRLLKYEDEKMSLWGPFWVCFGSAMGLLGVFLGPSWGLLGIFLGSALSLLGVRLGSTRSTWGPLGVHLGSAWGLLGVWLGPLGVRLGFAWGPLGVRLGSVYWSP